MDGIVNRIAVPVLLLTLLSVAACGDDEQSASLPSSPPPAKKRIRPPPWPEPAPEQIAEAKRHGVPVAFENDLGLRFVLIPAGTFVMGLPQDDEGADCRDSQGEVTLTTPFYIQATEVTNAQYRRKKARHDSGEFHGHRLSGDAQPVVRVTWEDADSYAKWLSEQDGDRTYALPTELQWERACRAGTSTRFSWGESSSEGWRYANGLDPRTEKRFDTGDSTWQRDDGHRVSAAVASYRPNAWGLYDTAGNAWEFCADLSGRPFGKAIYKMRGGSYVNGPSRSSAGHVARFYANSKQPHIGFRLVSPLPEPGK